MSIGWVGGIDVMAAPGAGGAGGYHGDRGRSRAGKFSFVQDGHYPTGVAGAVHRAGVADMGEMLARLQRIAGLIEAHPDQSREEITEFSKLLRNGYMR